MLIGIDASRTTSDQPTGTDAYAYHLIRSLIPMTAGRHRLRLYFNSPPARGLFPESDYVEQVVIPFPRLWTHIRLAAELHLHPPDVFFTPAHVIPLTYRRPSVATVHDLGYHFFPDAHTLQQRLYLRWSTRHNAVRATHILADSEATKRDLMHFYDIPAEKIRIVYPALDPRFLREISTGRALKGTTKHPYLLFLGTLQPRKNVLRIVESFAEIAEQFPHNLILAGKAGWRTDALMQQIRSLDYEIQNRIFITGFIAEEGKAPLIAGADLLLYPSLHEGFGFPLLEANACGTPVIASNTSSLPELAGDGGALLIEPEDTRALTGAIHYLLTNREAREGLIEKGYANVRRFNWKMAAAEALAQLEFAGSYQPA